MELQRNRQMGIVQVYTGEGKGKTTAAWGLAMRAVGQGRKVAVVQFMKAPTSGERNAARHLSPLLYVTGETSPYNACQDQSNSALCREESRNIFKEASELLASGEWDVIILDEINVVLHYKYVTREEMMSLLDSRHPETELVLTGRGAPDWLIETADLVTEMKEIKHPAENGLRARRGIEY
jgi:cob(I)alamin adenosyltransferase